jgi:hypothetical protein
MEFTCIWYNMDQEVKRDIIEAKDSEEASAKVYSLYGGNPPAPALSIMASSGRCDIGGYFNSRW